jgi:flagellar basal-body rod modification protein FlgD
MSTTTNSVTNVPGVADLFTTGTKSTSSSSDSADRFLTLLVSQLKNQDPMNPLDNAQVTTQLAQINTVQGIEQLNASLTAFISQTQSAQGLAAANVIGHQVLVPGNSIALANGQAAAGFELDQAVDSLKVTITDAAGNVLHSADLGPSDAGLHLFAWDGVTDSGAAAAPGTYSFQLAATVAGKSATANALALGRVDGVVPSKDGVTLTLGGLPPTAYSQVRQIL